MPNSLPQQLISDLQCVESSSASVLPAMKVSIRSWRLDVRYVSLDFLFLYSYIYQDSQKTEYTAHFSLGGLRGYVLPNMISEFNFFLSLPSALQERNSAITVLFVSP
jgi:hypothetical protein